MDRNATYRLNNTSVLSVCGVEAPVIATSAQFDERLAATYERVGMRAGMLEQLAGVRERRWWPADVTFVDAAAMAGAKALAEAGVDPSQIGVMINNGNMIIRLEDIILGKSAAPQTETAFGVYCKDATVAVEMARLTAL